jgi:uroporphyrinogen decarboxylase
MNSLQRVIATLQGLPVDRKPVTMTLCLYGARLINCPLEQYFIDKDAYCRGQKAVREAFDPDILFGPFAFAQIGAAFGSQVRFFANQAPNIKRSAIQSIAQLDTLHLPDPDKNPELRYIEESIASMVTEHGHEVPVAAIFPNPIDLPALIMGLDAWMETVLFDPSGAARMLDFITPFFLDFAGRLFNHGIAFMAFPTVFASPSVLPRDMVRQFTLPALQKILAQLQKPVVLHHGGAPILQNLDLLRDLPGVAAMAVDYKDDLDQSRAAIGPDLTLLGGLTGPSLDTKSAAEVGAACLKILKNRQQDPHFILYTCGADIPLSTPEENILAIRRSVEREV